MIEVFEGFYKGSRKCGYFSLHFQDGTLMEANFTNDQADG